MADNKFKCSECFYEKHESEFSFSQKKKGHRMRCKSCVNQEFNLPREEESFTDRVRNHIFVPFLEKMLSCCEVKKK